VRFFTEQRRATTASRDARGGDASTERCVDARRGDATRRDATRDDATRDDAKGANDESR
jgi:hypothetical protein